MPGSGGAVVWGGVWPWGMGGYGQWGGMGVWPMVYGGMANAGTVLANAGTGTGQYRPIQPIYSQYGQILPKYSQYGQILPKNTAKMANFSQNDCQNG